MKKIHPRSDGYKQKNKVLFFVHLIYHFLVILCNYRTLQLQSISQFATFHTERFGQKCETFHLLIVGKLLLQGIYASTEQTENLRMLQQFFHILIFNAFFLGIIFHKTIDRYNKGRHKFTLVGNNGNLIDITINSQFRF